MEGNIMTEINTTQQTAELTEDLRSRIAEVPREIMECANEALKRESIDYVGRWLWKEGHSFSSRDLYEYRETLFPPGAMVDRYTAGPPVLRSPAPESG